MAALAVSAGASASTTPPPTPVCALHVTLLDVALLAQARDQHKRISVADLDKGWPEMVAAARRAKGALPGRSSVARQLSTRFDALEAQLERADAALRTRDMKSFWTILDRAKPDLEAVSTLTTKAGLACTIRDGRGGTVTIR